MTCKSLALLCALLVSLAIVSQGVLAARELAETVRGNASFPKLISISFASVLGAHKEGF